MENRSNAESDIYFLNGLGRKKYGDSFSISNNWSEAAIKKIVEHFRSFQIKERTLCVPSKGLFICSAQEDEASVLNHLLNVHIKDLYYLAENESYYSRVENGSQINIRVFSAREIAIESLQSRPHDIIKRYSEISILSLIDFGKETPIKFPNYNKLDVIPELLNIRYQKKFYKTKAVTNVFTNCTPRELSERYSKDVFFHLKSLTDEILLSSPE